MLAIQLQCGTIYIAEPGGGLVAVGDTPCTDNVYQLSALTHARTHAHCRIYQIDGLANSGLPLLYAMLRDCRIVKL
ncbi:hypothetical protein J6590_031816 [Homalodisca vitripennis]|nr:hypothetical protein J6590_031816 [Homalodisca vitripennis]